MNSYSITRIFTRPLNYCLKVFGFALFILVTFLNILKEILIGRILSMKNNLNSAENNFPRHFIPRERYKKLKEGYRNDKHNFCFHGLFSFLFVIQIV